MFQDRRPEECHLPTYFRNVISWLYLTMAARVWTLFTCLVIQSFLHLLEGFVMRHVPCTPPRQNFNFPSRDTTAAGSEGDGFYATASNSGTQLRINAAAQVIRNRSQKQAKKLKIAKQRAGGGAVGAIGATGLPRPDQCVRVEMAKRGNKMVTIIRGLQESLVARKVGGK